MTIALILILTCTAILLFILFRPRRSPYSRRVTGSRNGQPWYRDLENRNRPVIRLNWILLLLALMLANTAVVQAQEETTVPLHIRLRAADGSAVVGESVILERLPEEEVVSPDCITNATGQCTWYVEPGLYQVLFARSLDDISALAVAEGGLRGLGLTVGQTAVTYHFTFHSDTRVYFDAAPNSAVPEPIIPAETHQHAHGAAVTPPADSAETHQHGQGAAVTPSVDSAETPDHHETAMPLPSSVSVTNTQISAETTGQPWRPLVYITLGLVVGVGLHLLQRRSKQAPPAESDQTLGLRQVWPWKRPKAAEKQPDLIEGQSQIFASEEEETD